MDNKEMSASSESPPRNPIKKEKDEEIKEFAETAMNELLGWYGYERLELRRWAASRAKDTSSPENQNAEQKDNDECTWCNKSVTSENGAIHHSGATFCSELCFSQSRRANFKRAKTCDWCRHVRHTVAYVDFKDGAIQLQFCSEKCLNQYKMHIFCRETQAHLDLNPHLINSTLINSASSSTLITPDLWLKNCKSPSQSPKSESSRSPNLEIVIPKVKPSKKSPIPLITVASPSKLMKPKALEEKTRKSPESRNLRKGLRKRRLSKCTSTVTSQTNSRPTTTTPKAQDLRMCSPSTSSPTSTNNPLHSPPNLPLHPPQFPNPMFGMQPPMFMDNPQDPRLPMFPPHFMPRPNLPFPQEPRLNFPPPLNIPQVGLGQPPPVTVLVPYPVVIPIPFPIPIPLPLSAFLEANSNKYNKESNKVEESEGPLDFTMNSEKNKQKDRPMPAYIPHESDIDESVDGDRFDEYRVGEKDVANPEHSLPKFKITRVGNNLSKIVPKRDPSESSRPLRKRRRLVEPTNEDDNIPKRKIVQV